MNSTSTKLITLSCPSCGAKLEITPSLDRFACAFCGQEHIVNRTGGTISLSPVVEAIHQVKTGVDKTAAELAIVRIQKEISNLKVKRENILDKSPSPEINNLFIIPIIIGGFVTITQLVSLIYSPPINSYCLGIGILLMFIGGFPFILLPERKRDWEQSIQPRINNIDEQIAEKKAELEKNQNLVRN